MAAYAIWGGLPRGVAPLPRKRAHGAPGAIGEGPLRGPPILACFAMLHYAVLGHALPALLRLAALNLAMLCLLCYA